MSQKLLSATASVKIEVIIQKFEFTISNQVSLKIQKKLCPQIKAVNRKFRKQLLDFRNIILKLSENADKCPMPNSGP